MGGSIPIGAVQAARLLIGLRLRRLRNRYDESLGIFRRRRPAGQEIDTPSEAPERPAEPQAGEPRETAEGKRAATPGKVRAGSPIAILVGIGMAAYAFLLASQALVHMHQALGTAPAAAVQRVTMPSLDQLQGKARRPAPPGRVALPKASGTGLAAGVIQAVTLSAFVLMLATLLLAVGSSDLSQPDWDLEWLVTFPMSMPALLAVRIAERTLVSSGVLLVWPFLTAAAWKAGHDTVPGLLLGLMAAVPLLAIVATLRTLLDTGLRLSLSPAALRNLQALVSVLAVLLLYLAYSAGLSSRSYIIEWAPWAPRWASWLPPGLATDVVAGTQRLTIARSFLLLVLETAAIAVLGLAVLMRQLRLGVVATGARESGRQAAVHRAPASVTARRWLLTAVQARELRLLLRDRNFLVQTLVLPVVMLGAQLMLNRDSGLISVIFASPSAFSAAAFVVAANALMFSAFQTLNTEGPALWILYSVPRPLGSILWEKAVLWGIVCLAYPLALLAAFIARDGEASLQLLGYAAIVLAGVPIFAVIATALGIFASDPLAPVVQRRVRPSYAYLYLLLVSLYTYAIAASFIWQRIGLMVMTALLGLALWQKARDHLPYLLDPAMSPPPRVSLADGLVAGMAFFVLQAVAIFSVAGGGGMSQAGIVVIGFFIAGVGTFFSMQYSFNQRKIEGVPRFVGAGGRFGPGEWGAVAWGAGAGAAAAAVAAGYIWVIRQFALFDIPAKPGLFGPGDELWVLALTVAAAPVFEEFIFRGLIFGGLRRTLGVAASALASAAIFAIVHPPMAAIPVFGLGLAAALVYERTRLLIGAVATHAVYNALVVGSQFLP